MCIYIYKPIYISDIFQDVISFCHGFVNFSLNQFLMIKSRYISFVFANFFII